MSEETSKLSFDFWWCEIPSKEITFDLNEFKKPYKLGHGAYGNVYLGKYNGKICAIKQSHCLPFNDPFNDHYNQDMLEHTRKEIQSLCRLVHENTVKFYGYSIDKKKCYIIMEFVKHGSLEDVLGLQNQKKLKLLKKDVISISKDIICGLFRIHGRGLIHRDLKIQNILIDKKENNSYCAKICDFGATRNLSSFSCSRYSPYYCAPELNDNKEDPPYSFKSDVYSLGVVLNSLIIGKEINEYPLRTFPVKKKDELDFLIDIIIGSCKKDPQKRLSMEEVCEIVIRSSPDSSFCTKIFYDTFYLLKKSKLLLEWCNILFSQDKNNCIANEYMGEMYRCGIEFQKNFQKAFKFYQKSAKRGNTGSQKHLGCMFEHGLGKKKNFKKAIKFYRKSALKGNSHAQNNLGCMYRHGLGVEKNLTRSLEYYKIAAEQGDENAQNNLGYMYQYALGTQKNYKKAIEYYQKSSAQGNKRAQNNLGYMYQYALGVEKSFKMAVKYYEKSANKGDKDAQNNLGFMYRHGKGVEKNYEKAIEYYEKSAEQGHEHAQNNLGSMYVQGLGVEKNYQKAMEYFQESAKRGNVIALKNLGLIFENGLGVEISKKIAEGYFSKAKEIEERYISEY